MGLMLAINPGQSNWPGFFMFHAFLAYLHGNRRIDLAGRVLKTPPPCPSIE